jgi:hypothetical protein
MLLFFALAFVAFMAHSLTARPARLVTSFRWRQKNRHLARNSKFATTGAATSLGNFYRSVSVEL